LLASCSEGSGSDPTASVSTDTSPSREISLVVDTDLAADDLIALAYLASSEDIDLQAVTVSGTGEVSCPRGTEIARGLLDELGRPDVPVACGASDPLSGTRRFPSEWREFADAAWELDLPAGQASSGTDAVSLLTELLSSDEPVTILTLGPLTNLAQVLLDREDLASNIRQVVTMGGAVDVAGNVVIDGSDQPLDAEWNVYVDPEAAATVLSSGVPFTLVPLDASNGMPVTESWLELLVMNDTTPATAIVRQLLERYPPPYLWDPLAAIAAAQPGLVPSRTARVEVIVDGANSGSTIETTTANEITVAQTPEEPDTVFRHMVQVLAGVDEGSMVIPTTVVPLGEVTLSFDGTNCTFTTDRDLRAGTYLVDLAPSAATYWGVVAQLADGTTMDDAVDWINSNPDTRPPMVNDLVTIGEGVLEPPGAVEFRPGRVGLACVTADESLIAAATLDISDN
jgi:pyrimidine-specific ribonucleoside hydrolase